jgi:hypothetical protein
MAKATEVILAVMQEVQGVSKKNKNESQGFNFRGIDAVLNAVGPALRKHGGFILPFIVDKTHDVVPSRNGGSLNVVRLTVEFSVVGSDGEPVKGTVAAEAFDSGDKATAKAMSVALRTFLIQMLALPTDEPDPDTFSYELGEKQDQGVDFIKKLNSTKSIDDLRDLYLVAQKAKAPDQVLQMIKDKSVAFE